MTQVPLIHNPSIITRVVVGKTIGLALGVTALLFFWVAGIDVPVRVQIAALFWYVFVGAFIGFFGVITRSPLVIKVPLPWWVRGSILGGDMNLILVLFAYGELVPIMMQICPDVAGFWTLLLLAVLEGILVGLLIDYFATRLGGEGSATVTADTQAT